MANTSVASFNYFLSNISACSNETEYEAYDNCTTTAANNCGNDMDCNAELTKVGNCV